MRNGILCVQLDGALIRSFGDIVTIDLPNQMVDQTAFDIHLGDKKMLIEGLDGIGLTLQNEVEILAYFEQDKIDRPWVY